MVYCVDKEHTDEVMKNLGFCLSFGWLLVINSGEPDYLQYGKQSLGIALAIGALI